MARRRISPADGVSAIQGHLDNPNETDLTTAVRYLLEELAERAPGNSVEVRVAPYGATQCIEGPRHTRGTPANVIEMKPQVWFDLALGRLSWQDALKNKRLSVSGLRADLEKELPLLTTSTFNST